MQQSAKANQLFSFLLDVYRICSAYDEFLKDQPIDQFFDNTVTEQRDQIKLENRNVGHQSGSESKKGFIRQSKRIAERYLKDTNRPSTKNTKKSIVRGKHSISRSSKCNEGTLKQKNIFQSQSESLVTKQKLPDIRKELNIPQYSTNKNINRNIMADDDLMEMASSDGDAVHLCIDKKIMSSVPIETNTETDPQKSIHSGRKTKTVPIIILSDFYDLLKSNGLVPEILQ